MPGEDLDWGGGVTLNQFMGGMSEDSSWGGTLTQRQLVDSGGVPGGGGEGGSPTSLSIINRNASTLDIASSTGVDATVPAATTLLAGLLTAADKTLLDSLGVIAAALAPVATSGAYADLSGRPTLGNAAARNVGTAAGTVAAGDDARFTDARAPLPHTQLATSISDSTAAGRALFTAANVPAQQVLLGLSPVALSGAYGDLSGIPTLPTPGGSTGQTQYRTAGGAFAGASGLLIDPTSGRLTLASFLAGTAPAAPTTGFTLYANPSNALSWRGANGFIRTFDGTSNTADRAYTLQNKSGTIAHLDDITAANAGAQPLTFASAAITYAATIDLDMAALTGLYRTISLTGNLTLTSSNRADGRTVTLRLICDGTLRTLTVPAGWVFLGSKPANIAATKTGVLSLTFFGTADADCIAAWGVQA